MMGFGQVVSVGPYYNMPTNLGADRDSYYVYIPAVYILATVCGRQNCMRCSGACVYIYTGSITCVHMYTGIPAYVLCCTYTYIVLCT